MTGSSPLVPDPTILRQTLSACRRLEGPYGTVLELCIRTISLPWEVVAIDLAEIDWAHGCVPVPTRGGKRRMLHLPPEAVRTIVRVSGSTPTIGQAVTAGVGRPIDRRDMRLDRIRTRLAMVMPERMAEAS